MKLSEISDEAFYKMYEASQNEVAQDFLEKNLPVSTQSDVLEIIDHLIGLRQSLKDAELERLKSEAENLFKRLKEIQFERIFEEINCFKEISFLHKKLI